MNSSLNKTNTLDTKTTEISWDEQINDSIHSKDRRGRELQPKVDAGRNIKAANLEMYR